MSNHEKHPFLESLKIVPGDFEVYVRSTPANVDRKTVEMGFWMCVEPELLKQERRVGR